MTIEEARALSRGVEWRGSRPGLSRVRELLHRIGDPQDTLQFVHIAGTNGKGSTAATVSYTHLDVYKRQVPLLVLVLDRARAHII